MTKFLDITISGPTASGKTTAAVIIKKALLEAGFNVTLSANSDGDQESMEERVKSGVVLNGIKGIPVQINEVQTSRTSLVQVVQYVNKTV